MSYRTEDQRAPYKRAHAHYKAHLPFYLLKAFSQADRHPSTIDELCESLLPEVLAKDKNVGFPIRSQVNNVRRWIKERMSHEPVETKCRYKDDVQLYVNSSLRRESREKAKRLEKHMYGCSGCQIEFMEYFAFYDFGQGDLPHAPEALMKKIEERAERSIQHWKAANKGKANF